MFLALADRNWIRILGSNDAFGSNAHNTGSAKPAARVRLGGALRGGGSSGTTRGEETSEQEGRRKHLVLTSNSSQLRRHRGTLLRLTLMG